jgi:hypothetical protein
VCCARIKLSLVGTQYFDTNIPFNNKICTCDPLQTLTGGRPLTELIDDNDIDDDDANNTDLTIKLSLSLDRAHWNIDNDAANIEFRTNIDDDDKEASIKFRTNIDDNDDDDNE